MGFVSQLTIFDHQTTTLAMMALLRFAQLWSGTQPCSHSTSVVSACASSGLVFAESCLIGCKQYESMYYKRLCILYILEKAVTRNCHYDGFSVSAGPPRPSHNCVLIVLCISRLTIFDRQITFASGNLWRVLPPSSIVIARFCPNFVFFITIVFFPFACC